MRMNTSGKLGHTVLKWIFSSNLFFLFLVTALFYIYYCDGLPLCQPTPTFSKASQLLYFEVAVISVWSGFDTCTNKGPVTSWILKLKVLWSCHVIFENIYSVLVWVKSIPVHPTQLGKEPYTFSAKANKVAIPCDFLSSATWTGRKVSADMLMKSVADEYVGIGDRTIFIVLLYILIKLLRTETREIHSNFRKK